MTSKTLNRYNSTTPEVTKNFKIYIFLKKLLRSIFWLLLLSKNGIFSIFKSVSVGNRHFICLFCTFRAAWKAYLTSMTPSTTTPGQGTLPRQQLAHQAVLEPPSWSLALSKSRHRASDYCRAMMQSLPLSCWSPEKSYMTSSHKATSIYEAARFRVQLDKQFRKKNVKKYVTLGHLSIFFFNLGNSTLEFAHNFMTNV